ncbi:hypothetical protein [Sediminispirochaeta bajacaliforniensis]|uniref:hypothetical protein n=1 Tax=Sediminispirochaeta bajacaliforniensis TaxID=148 RepID=UPI001FDECE8B|nr:hypothetical protein [Sediminispirochaeta bajacaliforniensis]
MILRRFFPYPILMFSLLISLLCFSCATRYPNAYLDTSMYRIEQDRKSIEEEEGLSFPLSEKQYLEEDINGHLPETIYIKTRTQTFNTNYNFILVDGRIYYKSKDEETKPTNWALLTKTGLPHRRFSLNFHHASRIVEISADADELMALSDEGVFYRIKLGYSLRQRKERWYDVQGWPYQSQLKINPLVVGNRAWSIGIRNDQVLWYEDIYHNQHHYGTMGINTIYVLGKEGQEIRFADTGLPSDFSHNLLGPERGSFIAESISASASTMFLINAAGEMYTRLADFDTIGSDPMFYKYTYEKQDFGIAGSDYRSNFTPWALPSEPWQRQPPINLSEGARLSRRITILQTGRGNEARELRVAGSNAAGENGYYYKMLTDQTWSFRKAPLFLSEEDFLDDQLVRKGSAPRGIRQEHAFEGRLWTNNLPDSEYTFSIPDFSIQEGSCHLIILRGEESFTLVLHPVEMWTYLKRYNPGRDGTAKLFFITTEVSTDYEALSPEFSAMIRDYIAPESLQLFAYVAEATSDYVLIKPKTSRNQHSYLFLTKSGEEKPYNPEIIRTGAEGDDTLISRYMSEELVLKDPHRVDIRRRSEVEKKLAENIEYRKTLDKALRLFRGYARSSDLSRLAYSAFDGLSFITFMQHIDFPKIKTLTMFGEPIMENNHNLYTAMAENKDWLYGNIIELLDLRIAAYRDLLEDFDDNNYTAAVSPHYAEDYIGYFHKLGIPSSTRGSLFLSDGTTAQGKIFPISPLFPGFLIVNDDTSDLILVELIKPGQAISHLLQDEQREKVLKTKVRFYLMHASDGAETALSSLQGASGWIEWDDSHLTVVQRISLLKAKRVFIAFTH